MKLSFFAAALIGLISQADALSLEGHEFDFADYELAEVEEQDFDTTDLAQIYEAAADYDFEEDVYAQTEESMSDDDLFAETEESDEDLFAETEEEEDDMFAQISAVGEGHTTANAITDAECEKMQNGMVIRIDNPECNAKVVKKEPFENAMLSAMKELGSKSNELATALELQFKKNEKLAKTNTVSITGSIDLTPAA